MGQRLFVAPVSWFALSLLCADLGLLLTLLTSHSERLWRAFRRPALLALQIAGVLLVTWVDVSCASQSGQEAVLNQGQGYTAGAR